jgi:WD40 repeat protein
MLRRNFISLLVRMVVLCTLTMLCGYRSASLNRLFIPHTDKEITLELVAEYKKNHLRDISSDGKLLLFYQTSTPMRTYRVTTDGNISKSNQPDANDDVLRVVELESGRELSRTRTAFFPLNEQFVPGTKQIYYAEPKPHPQQGRMHKLFDFTSGQTKVCLDAPEGGFSDVVFLDQHHAFGTVSQENGGESLAKLTLPECARSILGPIDSTFPQGRTWGELTLSPDKKLLAYTVYAGPEVILWDISHKQVAKTFYSAPLYFGSKRAFTPDGKLLIVTAGTKAFGGDDIKRYLLFYDTKTYELVRRLEVPEMSAIAVSPDSQKLALAYTEKQRQSLTEQAVVVLYDLATGKELGRASHPSVREQRSDPFMAKISHLFFTPDGAYLLSSTYDTRIWRIGLSPKEG